MSILDEMKVRRLYCDGGMGSLLQAAGLLWLILFLVRCLCKVRIAYGVTSEPVPQVVGIHTTGRYGRGLL